MNIEIEHLAATPEGFKVTFRARVIHSSAPLSRFKSRAHDGSEAIAKGLHKVPSSTSTALPVGSNGNASRRRLTERDNGRLLRSVCTDEHVSA